LDGIEGAGEDRRGVGRNKGEREQNIPTATFNIQRAQQRSKIQIQIQGNSKIPSFSNHRRMTERKLSWILEVLLDVEILDLGFFSDHFASGQPWHEFRNVPDKWTLSLFATPPGTVQVGFVLLGQKNFFDPEARGQPKPSSC